jgi:hypothetical protein
MTLIAMTHIPAEMDEAVENVLDQIALCPGEAHQIVAEALNDAYRRGARVNQPKPQQHREDATTGGTP